MNINVIVSIIIMIMIMSMIIAIFILIIIASLGMGLEPSFAECRPPRRGSPSTGVWAAENICYYDYEHK